MKRGTKRDRRRQYAIRRNLRKVSCVILLVLLSLAFIGIRRQESAGTQEFSGLVSTQKTGGQQENPGEDFSLDMVPAYSGRAYADINGDVPFFTKEEMTDEAFHEYWPLDELGRCTGAYACVGPETLPTQERGDISSVKPTGWNTNRYSDIDGEMLFNRCHLIGHLLTGQDANERNLITGTRYMNVEGMLPFEESVVRYVEGTGHHVMYRVRPYFDGNNLVCAGVLMEARSVEDPRVQFCAFCYNVQPGFEIDYATGNNRRANASD